MRRKMFLALAVAALVVMMGTSAVFACGHSGRSTSTKRTVCGVESCALTGLHTHDGVSYYAHYDGDGHTYHGICDVDDCTLTGYHDHDGAYCFGRVLDGTYSNIKSKREAVRWNRHGH